MGTLIDLSGQVFGRLTVISRAENDKTGKTKWICMCTCGNIKHVLSNSLRTGRSRSCGCMKGNRASSRKPTIEKHSNNNRLYKIWDGMHYRCENPNAGSYKNYGGRGITVCPDWTGGEGFDRFREWAVAHGYAENLQIDRIDNDLGYEPDNCRWVTQQENSLNRRPRGPSRFSGVAHNKRTGEQGRWRACIKINGRNKYLGTFKTKDEAIAARKKAEMEIGLRKE